MGVRDRGGGLHYGRMWWQGAGDSPADTTHEREVRDKFGLIREYLTFLARCLYCFEGVIAYYDRFVSGWVSLGRMTASLENRFTGLAVV